MKMVVISYNEAMDEEVKEAMKECGLENFTLIKGVFGCGTTSGKHLGNDIWPGLNNLLYIACENDKAGEIMTCVSGLRRTLGKEGIKAFVMPIEALT